MGFAHTCRVDQYSLSRFGGGGGANLSGAEPRRAGAKEGGLAADCAATCRGN